MKQTHLKKTLIIAKSSTYTDKMWATNILGGTKTVCISFSIPPTIAFATSSASRNLSNLRKYNDKEKCSKMEITLPKFKKTSNQLLCTKHDYAYIAQPSLQISESIFPN